MVKHIVMWNLHNPIDALLVKAELDSCNHLVDGMLAFEVGIRAEGLEANCDVVLYASFSNREVLAAYQVHPHHQQVSQRIGLLRSQRWVLDYDHP